MRTRLIRMLGLFIALGLLLGTPAMAQEAIEEETILSIDQFGLSMEVTSFELEEDKLRFNATVANNTGRTVNMYVNDAYIDDIEVDGIGMFGIDSGESVEDYFFFKPLRDDDSDMFKDIKELRFAIEVDDRDTGEYLFTLPVYMYRDGDAFYQHDDDYLFAYPEFDQGEVYPEFGPEDAYPEFVSMPYPALVLPDGGWGEWKFTGNNKLQMRVKVENESPTKVVKAFEIYMYATDVWNEPIYGKDYVYYETTEKRIEPLETAMSAYVTMPNANKIDRVYAGVHRVVYTDGTVEEADVVEYSYWDID